MAIIIFSPISAHAGSKNNSLSLNWDSGGWSAHGCGDSGGSRAISDFYVIARGPHVRNGGMLTVNVVTSSNDLEIRNQGSWTTGPVEVMVSQDRLRMSVRAREGTAIHTGPYSSRPWDNRSIRGRGFSIRLEKPSSPNPDYNIGGPRIESNNGFGFRLPRPNAGEPGLGLTVITKKIQVESRIYGAPKIFLPQDRGCADFTY